MDTKSEPARLVYFPLSYLYYYSKDISLEYLSETEVAVEKWIQQNREHISIVGAFTFQEKICYINEVNKAQSHIQIYEWEGVPSKNFKTLLKKIGVDLLSFLNNNPSFYCIFATLHSDVFLIGLRRKLSLKFEEQEKIASIASVAGFKHPFM